MYCGIDVGLRKCHAAVIDKDIVFVGDYGKLNLDDIKVVGIDAPLSFPAKGAFRECERILLKMGIRLFPSGAPFFRKVVIEGIKIAEDLKRRGIEVYEVYPYATRVILNIAPKAKKHKREGLAEIVRDLSKFIEVDKVTHDEIDAIIAALTVKMYKEGRGIKLRGSDGEIVVPKGSIQLGLWIE